MILNLGNEVTDTVSHKRLVIAEIWKTGVKCKDIDGKVYQYTKEAAKRDLAWNTVVSTSILL